MDNRKSLFLIGLCLALASVAFAQTFAGTWSAGHACPVSCGTGQTYRDCLLNGQQVDYSNCEGSSSIECDTGVACPFPGVWSAPLACPVSCGIGQAGRNCLVNGQQADFSNCEGSSFVPCNTGVPCPSSSSSSSSSSSTGASSSSSSSSTADAPSSSSSTGGSGGRPFTYIDELTRRPVTTYFPTWTSPGNDLDTINENYNVVSLAFARPDLTYTAGQGTLVGTGLEFHNPSVELVRQGILELKQQSGRTIVLLSVGGITYTGWTDFNAEGVAALARDLGVDGVTLDFEMPTDPYSPLLTFAVLSLRPLLPRPFVLSFAGFSVGAYGEGQWANAQPVTQYTGLNLDLLNNPEANAALDAVFIMAYEAGPSFNPLEAYRAFQFYLPGAWIALGMLVGAPETTREYVRALSEAVRPDPRSTVGTWELRLPGDPDPIEIAQIANSILNPGVVIP